MTEIQVIDDVDAATDSQWSTSSSPPGPRARSSDVLSDLARLGTVVAVVAHPDDESFGLGALLAALATAGADTRLVCFTHGEASTLGSSSELGVVRRDELVAAADVLGVKRVRLADYPDGGLGGVPAAVLDSEIEPDLAEAAAVVVFEPAGVTGHLDHVAATAAAMRIAGRHGLPVLQWGVAPQVAAALNAEFGTAFVALAPGSTWSSTGLCSSPRSPATRASRGTTRSWPAACSSREGSNGSGYDRPDRRPALSPPPTR